MVTLAPILSATLQRDCVCCSIGVMMSSHGVGLRERRWFVLERPRRDTNGGSETEVTVTSERQAKA